MTRSDQPDRRERIAHAARHRLTLPALVLVGLTALPACTSTLLSGGADDPAPSRPGTAQPGAGQQTALDGGADPAAGRSSLGNLLRFGTAAPAPVLEAPEDPIDCPLVIIAPGGAAVRLAAGGDSQSVRSQITITEVARECSRGPGGVVQVRVGAEGRVLKGPAGSSGAQFATLRMEVQRNGQTVATRTARVGGTVSGDAAQATWIHVEPAFAVPPGPGGDVDVVLSLTQGGAQPARRRR